MKNKIRAWIVFAIVFVVYSVVAVMLPFAHTAVFWLSYLFSVVAIAAQVYVMHTAFMKEESVKSKFYGFPIANVGFVYLIAQLVLGLIMMALAAKIMLWIPVVLYVLLLGVAAVGFIAADAMRDEVERQDIQLKKDVTTMRSLQSKAANIVAQCVNASIKSELDKLSEALRFSDPVSSEAVTDIEAKLVGLMSELQTAVMNGNNEETLNLCAKAQATLAERNQMCKLSK